MEREKSQEIYLQLCEVLPEGVNSPVRAWPGLNHSPMIVEHASDDLIYDVDGNRYIDYCMSWGALVHGHANLQILQPVKERLSLGTSFGVSTSIEEKLARQVVEMVPSIERVRFVNSGTEATMSAVRLARGYTGKNVIIKFTGNYHGHADFFLVQAGSGVTNISSSAGVPDDVVRHVVSLPYNDVEETRNYLQKQDNIAAVIVEPIAGNMGVVPASTEFLKMLREETQKNGSLFIFDEVITGFRVAKGGAQELYDIIPDITCLGKIVGGGFPAAAFGGRIDIMDCLSPKGKVYQAGTLSGNPIAMEAGYQALKLLQKPSFYQSLQDKADIITKPLQEYFLKENINASIQQVGSMFTLFFGKRVVKNMDDGHDLDTSLFNEFFNHMVTKGVYIPPSQYEAWFVSSSHSEAHLEKTRDIIFDFFKKI